jgi:hypothetical protein
MPSAFSAGGTAWTTFNWPTVNTAGYDLFYDGVDYVALGVGGQAMKLLK